MNLIIKIHRPLANRLLTLAQLTPEIEICGLIAKKNDSQYQVYPIDNVALHKQSTFEMQPQQQIAAFKHIRDQQQTLFGIFHSHPDSAATPSPKDQLDAAYHDTLNIIISLNTQGVLDMRAYYYSPDEITAVDLVIE